MSCLSTMALLAMSVFTCVSSIAAMMALEKSSGSPIAVSRVVGGGGGAGGGAAGLHRPRPAPSTSPPSSTIHAISNTPAHRGIVLRLRQPHITRFVCSSPASVIACYLPPPNEPWDRWSYTSRRGSAHRRRKWMPRDLPAGVLAHLSDAKGGWCVVSIRELSYEMDEDAPSAAPCRDDSVKADPVADDVPPPVFQPSLPGKAKLALVTGLAAHRAKAAEVGTLSSGANPLAEPLRQALQVSSNTLRCVGRGWAGRAQQRAHARSRRTHPLAAS